MHTIAVLTFRSDYDEHDSRRARGQEKLTVGARKLVDILRALPGRIGGYARVTGQETQVKSGEKPFQLQTLSLRIFQDWCSRSAAT